MNQIQQDTSFRVGFFGDAAQADNAVRNLLGAGFKEKELAIICPEKFKDQFLRSFPKAERPGSHAIEGLVEGGAIGFALGGVALVATAIATGGVGLLPAVPVLLGGGAIAGGLSGLIIADGYGKRIGQYYEEAIRLGEIVVGVHIDGPDSQARLEQADNILAGAGGDSPAHMIESQR